MMLVVQYLNAKMILFLFYIQARTQNMTVGVSFGAERDAAFEHAQNRCVVSMPQVTLLYSTLCKYVLNLKK